MSGDRRIPDVLVAARMLAIDAAGAEVVRALRAEGIEPVLIKGPTLDWLYPGEVREYVDADLLVPPERAATANAVLSHLGFERGDQPDLGDHSEPWFRRTDGAAVDLHISLWGANRPPSFVWRELQPHVEFRELATGRVRVLDRTLTALYVVLHAAQHSGAPKQRNDLVRLLRVLPEEAWPEIERVAHRLWALTGLADGLALLPEGRAILARLPLARAAALTREAPLAIAFARLAEARGIRAKLGVVAAIVRDPAGPQAAAGAPGPSADFAWRRVRLLATAPRTLLVLWRARRHQIFVHSGDRR
jgi:hypothetical protein